MKISLVITFIGLIVFACGGGISAEGTEQNQVDPLAAGKKVYNQFCVACHGKDGKLAINGAKDFAGSDLKLEERIAVITNGQGMMTPFKGVLKPEQIKAAAEYTIHLGSQKEE